jgi:hypothetical protein
MFLKRGRRRIEPAAPHTEQECMETVRFMYATEEIRRDVFNALRRTGLSKNAAFDAMDEMERSYLVFGRIYGAQRFGELSEQLAGEQCRTTVTEMGTSGKKRKIRIPVRSTGTPASFAGQ